ncbi:hypothetical protein BDZ89DRAFT_1087507, partial [Hymenopellis radicata]
SEIPDYKFILKEASAVLTDLNSRIDKVQAILDNLILARNDAQKRADDAKAVLHPVRCIPPEILFEIFANCVATWHNPDPTRGRHGTLLIPVPSVVPFPRLPRWRALVLSSPQLWSYLELQFQTHRTQITKSQCAAKVSLWLERCANFPLSYDFSVYVETENDVQVDVFSSAPNLFIPSVQLTSAVFRHEFREWSVPHLRLMPNLTTLSLPRTSFRTKLGCPHSSPRAWGTAEAGALKALFGGFSAMAAHPSNTDNLLQFLSTTPYVTRLQIYDRALTAKFVAQMMVRNGETFSILPCLREFDMDEFAMSSSSPPAMGALTSRSMERRSRVETLWVPRWLYHRDDERWRNIRGSLEDIDDCIDYYCP